MKIVVLVKQVPCAVDGLGFAPDLTLRRTDVPAELNPADEVALDQALRVARRRREVSVTAVTMGPAGAAAALRRALVLGADEGVHVLDDGLHGCDAMATSRVLAATVRRLGYDLVLCGAASADAGTSAVPAMLAERLGVPALCFADALSVRDRGVEARRDDGHAVETFTAALPAVVSVTERCGQPRYPRFAARVEARHKLVRTWSLVDLGMDARVSGRRPPGAVVRAVRPRAGGRRVLVEGDPTSAAIRVADFLAERQFI